MLQAHDYITWCYEPAKPPGGFTDASDNSQFEKGGASRVKVLVVDDESTIAETLVEILNGEGFEAIAASAGDSALASAQSFGPDVVISDVVMPGMSGVDLGIRLREILPRCRVILFSGQTATVDLLREARKRGHEFEIVAKPVKPQTLIAMIRHRSN
jgi:DNA-binding NtrC family response regulator